jgi:hypothetical protein
MPRRKTRRRSRGRLWRSLYPCDYPRWIGEVLVTRGVSESVPAATVQSALKKHACKTKNFSTFRSKSTGVSFWIKTDKRQGITTVYLPSED